MPIATETREYFACDILIKEVGDAGTFTGHAAVTGNVDLGGDRIEPGAFKHTIAESGGRWPILMGHRQDQLIGFSTGAEEDSKGLAVTGEFTLDSTLGANAYASAKHAARLGQKLGLSIGYAPRKNGVEYDEAAGVRKLKDLTVYEFSIAPVPMNPRARIARVKADDMTEREIEDTLRDAGFSRTEATRLIHHMSALRDAGHDDGHAGEDWLAMARSAILLNAL